MADQMVSRVLALASLVLAVAVVAVVLLGGSGPYRIAARFVDAGQLVKGDLVEIGGRSVGTVTDLRLTDNGQADVELTFDDDSVTPLHEGTVATIRTVGLASVTNRVVAISPGPPTTRAIPDGAVLPPTQTRGVVDLDMLLNAVDPSVRRHLRTIVHQAARAFADPAPRQINRAFTYLNPALAQTAALGRELVGDRAAFERLVRTGTVTSSALASRADDVGAGIDSAAAALSQVAARRTELVDLLDRAPATLRQTRGTLDRLRRTLPVVDPLVRGLGPAVAPLRTLLTRAVPVARDAAPAIAQIRALLPKATRVLARLPGLDRAASPALRSATVALQDLLPIVAGLRAYAPDFIGGLFNGFGGSTSGYYDANGHFMRISLQGARSSIPGLPIPASPGFAGYETGLTARCPGAAEGPVADGSNPWVPDAGLCDPAQTP